MPRNQKVTIQPKKGASADQKPGQLIGDWFEEYFVLPLLKRVAEKLDLYLDHRFQRRSARGEKILWRDEDGNSVDYDFVMELGASNRKLGAPVAFFMCQWHRDSRHSIDKASDDNRKLSRMRFVHPSACFLANFVVGDFINPARSLARSREIDLFYIPKAKVVKAFNNLGITIDYPDQSPEKHEKTLANVFKSPLCHDTKTHAANELRKLIGEASLNTYVNRVRGALGVLPQEIRFATRRASTPRVFNTISDATAFLNNPDFGITNKLDAYVYQITYTDGTRFECTVGHIEKLRKLHTELELLANHITEHESN